MVICVKKILIQNQMNHVYDVVTAAINSIIMHELVR